MKSCLILLTLFAGFHAMPSNREDSFPQRIQMKNLESVCVERYGSLNFLQENWGKHQSDCLGWNRYDLPEDQFINIQDEHMFNCACSIYAVEVEWDYPALIIVNEDFKENMENYVDYEDYYENE